MATSKARPQQVSAGVDLSPLPTFVRSNLQSRTDLSVYSNDEFASVLARASGRTYYGGNFQDKEFFLKVAEATPDAFKIYYEVDYQAQPQAVVDLVDVRSILSAFASMQDVDPAFQNLAAEEIQRVTNTYTKWFADQGESAAQYAAAYLSNTKGLSPLGYSMDVSDVAEPSGTTNPVTEAGMQISDFGSGYGYGPVTQENQQAAFRLDVQRTIDNLIAELVTPGGSFYFDMEGFAQPANVDAEGNSWDVRLAAQYPYLGLSETQIQDLQSSLSEAGYYERIGMFYRTFGQVDAPTTMAWKELLKDSILFGMSPADMLKNQVENYARLTGTAMMGVPKKDESEIYNMVRDLGVNLIGRGLNDQELASLTQRFREWEKEIATGAWQARDPEAEALELQSKTEEYLRGKFEAEYLTQGISDFLNIFGKALQ